MYINFWLPDVNFGSLAKIELNTIFILLIKEDTVDLFGGKLRSSSLSMSKASEIRSLFLALASELQSTNPTTGNEAPNLDLTITNLNRSLNLSETTPRVRVMDTALSLMCFTSSQVTSIHKTDRKRKIIELFFYLNT